MKHIELFEQWVPKLSNEPVPISKVGSFGQRITNKGTKRRKKQDMIVATDDTIKQIVRDEIKRLGKDADLNHINVSQVTNMGFLFHNTNFRGDISEWDVSNVTNMDSMFSFCNQFDCDISKWDVGSVKYMQSMFYRCRDFNQDLSGWNVSSVINMNCMFYRCTYFNQDLSGWKVGSVTNMNYMFSGCSHFNQDLSGWDVRKIKSMNKFMFKECPIKEEFKPKF